MSILKHCNSCQQNLPIDLFGNNKNSPDKKSWYCKSCVNKRVSEYRQANPEKVRKQKAAFYRRHKEKLHDQYRQYRLRNKQQILQYRIDYYLKNKSVVNHKNKMWRDANPDKINKYSASRRARKLKATTFIIIAKDWRKLRSGVCFYCGFIGQTSIDHVIPLSRGGLHGIGNLVEACISCNCSKQDLLLVEWKARR
jgi:5-methylcytosine-specific restriction endonuclease McrA